MEKAGVDVCAERVARDGVEGWFWAYICCKLLLDDWGATGRLPY